MPSGRRPTRARSNFPWINYMTITWAARALLACHQRDARIHGNYMLKDKNLNNSFALFETASRMLWLQPFPCEQVPRQKVTVTSSILSGFNQSESKNIKNYDVRTYIICSVVTHSKTTFFMFLLLESFDIRQNMFWCWQEDGGSILSTRFMTTAKRSTQCQNFQEGYSGFCKNEGLRSVKEAGPELIGYW